MKQSLNILFTSVFLILSSCEVTKSETEDFKGRFEEHKIEFEKLSQQILSKKILLKKAGYHIPENEIDSEILNELENLDIQKINISRTDCDEIYEIEFIANWTKNAHLYFSKNNCNLENSKKGYHSKTTMIEVWGLGNGWIMWIDYDFI